MNYGYMLFVAILCETFATTALKQSQGFTRFWWTVGTLLGYAVAFYLLSHTLTRMTIGTVYAIWCGVGMALIAIIGSVFYKEKLDLAAWIGIALIVSGVLVLSLYSKTYYHEVADESSSDTVGAVEARRPL